MTIHRRTMLKSSLPVLAGAIATGAVANTMTGNTEATEIQRLYSKWQDLGNRYGGAIDENNAHAERLQAQNHPDRHGLVEDHYKECVEPLCDEFMALEDKMMEIPSRDFKDLAIKGRISARSDGVIDDKFHQHIRKDADRLLGPVNI
ncbi:hypothetical protein J7394_00110 [Ruegeria sp. R13_0]|uniref:hypothetical protein n=1 Tax=Ruegeria sp. R13_0 TaxID=2821099 RepID=UPI001ADB2742|nr:hypothetical protein [Ruegeria sp. R13_0]MBO9432587.1 hypothetical protein [Ruegeria sp. R13_0]